MATVTELRQRLNDIEAILQSGLTQSTVDGETQQFDHDTLRRERQQIRERLGECQRRHRVFNFNMGGR